MSVTTLGVGGAFCTRMARLVHWSQTLSCRAMHTAPATASATTTNVLERAYVDLSARRGLLAVSGPDATRFLNGLVTNMPLPGEREGVYSIFLNVRGRILYDVFIYPAAHNKRWMQMAAVAEQNTAFAPAADEADRDGATYLVEHDRAVAKELFTYLKFRKLRDKVNLRAVNDWRVWFAWEDPVENTRERHLTSQPTTLDLDPMLRRAPPFIGATDPRAPGMGARVVLSMDADSPLWPLGVYEDGRVSAFEPTNLEAYDARRYTFGVPEGVADLVPGETLPMEACVDMMGGINFGKGCYVGQELTTRAKRVGVTRRRIVPFVLYDEKEHVEQQLLEVDNAADGVRWNCAGVDRKAPILAAETMPTFNSRGEVSNSVGAVLSRFHNVGLARVRLDRVVLDGVSEQEEKKEKYYVVPSDGKGKLLVDEKAVRERRLMVKMFRPYWWYEEEEVSAH
ncbi:uncharacterized protein V1518DRAFT_418293 [Limtongia smithiae]|uniref:uncharacterized protein n=1 Tax=Limtongia smithiae TaxID=1125753 RepID=UPI0034CD5284